ncbi:PhzF family phenazine biosynthesis protein [Rhizobium helianthi]|uniref:PhzF family phenazine biosynthesis protein n=1 Tax=Rhizobium helianthi TaxID=1132695 RepID=A0ABW4LXL2_9HYPH
MVLRYVVYDVFTDTRLQGNPLAVIFGGDHLSDDQMQAVAQEFNLSETVFVVPAQNPTHAAKLRIFTPAYELPFAGHPTVGTAIALTEMNRGEGQDVDTVFVLEENVGPVRCAVRLSAGHASFAEFDLPRNPVQIELKLDRQGLADALGVKLSDLGFENHVPSVWSAGVPYLMLPLHNLAAVQGVEFDPMLWERVAPFVEGRLASAYIYCRGGVNHNARFHARMFSSGMGIGEDPATGSAVAALAGALHQFDAIPDGNHPILIEQGQEMGRPSYIHLHVDVKDGAISRARIGGQAVKVAAGELFL